MTKIPILECDEPLVDLRRDGRIGYGPPPECPETASHYCLVRVGIFEKLLRAQSKLTDGLRFRVYEGLRSLEVQKLLFEQEKARVILMNPSFDGKEIHERVSLLVSPVEDLNGDARIPPHSTGAAIDLEIVDSFGNVIDFGMEIREWPTVDLSTCAPICSTISSQAVSNRRLLKKLMTDEGFVQFHSEWWHFSFGDQYWAHKTNQSIAIYGGCNESMITAASAA